MELTAVDLFCGAGGFSKGFQAAGIRLVAAFDNWEPALSSYENNFNVPVYGIDLSRVNQACEFISEYRPDIVIVGPPCQEHSSAGNRRQSVLHGRSVKDFTEIAVAQKPKAIIIENVTAARNKPAWLEGVDVLTDNGYKYQNVILDASYYGVPQKRKRLFCIAFRDVTPIALQERFDRIASPRPTTVLDYMGDEIDFTDYYYHAFSYDRRSVYSVNEPAPTMRGSNRPVSQGCYDHHLNSAPIDTVKALTTHQRSRIQTFPKDFCWPQTLSTTSQEKLIGNAVPVLLGKVVAKEVSELLTQL